MEKSKTLLVTGGAGFIGSALIRFLIGETDYSVVNADELTYAADPAALAAVEGSERYHFEQVDICDGAALRRVFEEYRPVGVIHLAAESHVDRSIEGPAEFVRTNVVGTVSLLEAARAYWERLSGLGVEGFLDAETASVRGTSSDAEAASVRRDTSFDAETASVRGEASDAETASVWGEASDAETASVRGGGFRFVHVSTDEVYGELGEDGMFAEGSPYDPHSPYAASKAGADHFVRAWGRTYGLPVIVTNGCNNYGPWQHGEKLIPTVIAKAVRGERIPVYGSGENVREWLFVEDHVRALLAVLERGEVGGTYLIGSGVEKMNLEVVRGILGILAELSDAETASVRELEELIEFVEDRAGHDWRYAVDSSRVREELGWAPEVGWEEGLRRTVEWYVQQLGASGEDQS